MITTKQKNWLALWLIQGLGPVKIHKLVTLFGNIDSVFLASEKQLKGVSFLNENNIQNIRDALSSPILAKEEELIEQNNIKLMCFEDDDYPALLKNIASPPAVLYQKGNFSEFPSYLALAFIGARKASFIAKSSCQEVIKKLAKLHPRTLIISGLAYGLDSVAHQAAIQSNLPTVAVLGSGLCRIYPERHIPLAEQIVEQGGAIFSEFPMLQSPLPSHFPLRNRIISGLSQGVVVVEAGEKSGSRITANFALEQGKEVFAFPGAPNSHFTRGSNRLIQQGSAKLVIDAEDILEEYTLLNELSVAETDVKENTSFSTIEKNILAILKLAPTQIDSLVSQLIYSYQETMQALTFLEMKGYVQTLAGQTYAATKPEI